MDIQEVIKRFTFHNTSSERKELQELIRNGAFAYANIILHSCPDSREKSLAMTKLEEAVFWANASISRDDKIEEILKDLDVNDG